LDLSAPVLSFSLSPFSFSPALVILLGNSADFEKEKKKKKGKRVMLSSSLLSLALLFLSLLRSVLFSGFRFWLRRSGQLALVMKTFAEIVVVVYVFFKK
jgi:endo-1,4-beta-D-glucanase Y